jgi:hypothetical protein
MNYRSAKTTDWTWSSRQTVYNDGGNNVIKSSGNGEQL